MYYFFPGMHYYHLFLLEEPIRDVQIEGNSLIFSLLL